MLWRWVSSSSWSVLETLLMLCVCFVFLLLAWFYYVWANPWHILTSHFILWRVLSHKKVLLLSFCERIAQHFLKVFKKQNTAFQKYILYTKTPEEIWKNCSWQYSPQLSQSIFSCVHTVRAEMGHGIIWRWRYFLKFLSGWELKTKSPCRVLEN